MHVKLKEQAGSPLEGFISIQDKMLKINFPLSLIIVTMECFPVAVY